MKKEILEAPLSLEEINVTFHKHVYLGFIHMEFNLNPSHIAFLQWALLVTHRIILLHWKTKTSPKIKIWYDEMAQLASMESVMLSRINSFEKSSIIWKEFLDYFDN